MKIIFLDIDGVLNNTQTYKNPNKAKALNGSWFEPEKVELLNRILQKTKTGIVLTSAWRWEDHYKNIEMMGSLGISGAYRGRVDDLHSVTRGEQIQDFLDKTPQIIDKFIILDDENDMGDLGEYLIQTDRAFGLTEENVQQAIEHLT